MNGLENRRNLTINVHKSNADINFGMFRLCSSLKAETLELVIERIKDFGLAMDDIVAFAMMKIGRLAPCEF